jgi:hypothetical protein
MSETPENSSAIARGRHSFSLSLAGVAVLLGYYALKADVGAEMHLLLGLLIAVLSTAPALAWVKRARTSLPAFEVFMLTGLNAYALPLLSGHEALLRYSVDEITTAALAVVVFQISAIALYETTSGPPQTGRFWRDELITQNIGQWLLYGMAVNTGYTCVSTFTTLVPSSLEGIFRAVFFGIGLICTFITSRRLGANELTPGERSFFFFILVVQCLTTMATLFLVGAVSTLLLAVIGYVSSSRRVPFVLAITILAVLAVLHNGKSAMRDLYWKGDDRIIPSPTQLPAFYTQWVREGIKPSSNSEETKLAAKLVDRTSLFQMMCLVTSITPSQQPFLRGETYFDIPAQLVPRFLWANKPLGHVSTSKLSVYFGIQSEEDTEKTTIGFGLLAEAYANFGFIGLLGVGGLFGFTIKKAQCWASESPMLSGGGLLIVILLAWSFQTEFTLSMWISSFYQACLAILAVPYALNAFLNR